MSRVLIVAAEQSTCVALQATLEEAGYATETSADFSQAEALLTHQSCDVIVADTAPPSTGSPALLRRVRQVDEDIPVILIADESDRAALSEATQRGAYAYVPRSASAETLKQVVRHAVEKKRLLDTQRRLESELEARVAARTAELERRNQELATLIHIGHDLSTTLDPPEVLKRVAQRIAQACDAHRCTIFMLSSDGDRLIPSMSQFRDGHKDREMWDRFQRLGQSMPVSQVPEAHQVILERQPLFIPDTSTSTLPPHWFQPFNVRSLLFVPLISKGQVIGLMGLDQVEKEQGFTPEQIDMALAVGAQAAVAMENARLLEKERRQRKVAETLREASGALNTSLDRERVLSFILEQLARIVPYDSASVMLLSHNGLEIVAQRGLESKDRRDIPSHFEELQHLAAVLKSRHPLIIADTRDDPRWRALPISAHIRCWLGAPLVVQDRTIGVLNLDRKQPNSFTNHDTELAVSFANHAAIAIENARLFESERRQLGLAQTLQEVGTLLTTRMSLKDVLERIFDLLARVVAYDSVSVQLVNEQGSVDLVAGRGFPDPERAEEIARTVARKTLQERFSSRKVWVIPDTHADPNWIPGMGHEYIRSWIGAALLTKERLVGVLNVDSATPNAYDASTGETVAAFANQAAIAIENARLHASEQKRSETLLKALEQQRELDRLKTEFVQNVSHELRTPLAIARGYAELLNNDDLGELQPQQREPVAILTRRIRMLSALMDDLGALLDAEAKPLRRQRVNLEQLVREAVDDSQAVAAQAGLTLTAEIVPPLSPLPGDPTHLRRVLDNLLSNAIKFTPRGGRVTVHLYQEGSETVLEIADTGIGIPEDQLERIFERFYQVDGSTTRRYGGTGLGLALVKEIVKSHRGHISVRSTEGRGSVFRVTLPND